MDPDFWNGWAKLRVFHVVVNGMNPEASDSDVMRVLRRSMNLAHSCFEELQIFCRAAQMAFWCHKGVEGWKVSIYKL